MKKKLFFAGMLVCVLAFGMAVVGCGDKEEENTDPKTIRITGLSGKSGEVEIMLFSSLDSGQWLGGSGTISGDAVDIPLYFYTSEAENPTRWTGTGAYYLMLSIGDEEYTYTDGKTLAQLDISIDDEEELAIAKLPKYSITAATSPIPLSKFLSTPL